MTTTMQAPDIDQQARAYIQALQAGEVPDDLRLDMGRWEQAIQVLEEAYSMGQDHAACVSAMLSNLIGSGKYPGLADLLTVTISPAASLLSDDDLYPELPQQCLDNQRLASQASPTLDRMIDFFRYWATRSYDGYHEAVAIWTLSTIAARRVYLPWRKGQWTPLYIMLVSTSTTHAKTEAASYGKQIIEEAGLHFLLSPDEITPQKLMSNMAGQHLPRNYSYLDSTAKEFVRRKLAFAGQRGWLYDEFGNKLQEIVKGKGSNNYFYGLLKQLYDSKRSYEYDTISRSGELIDMPYLSIIGTATPACLKPIAGMHSSIWTDGTFARIAFVVPPKNEIKLQSAPNEQCIVPEPILDVLRAWHQRLGEPQCEIVATELLDQLNGDDQRKKKAADRPEYEIRRGQLPQTEVWMPHEVYQAHQLYYKSLVEVAQQHGLDERFRATYGRLPDMALRIAMLLTSLEGHSSMNMAHWGRGQEIAEHWRRDFHELIAQLSSNDSIETYGDIEDRVVEILTKKVAKGQLVSARDISQRSQLLRAQGSPKVREILEELVATGVLIKDGNGRSAKYGVP